MHKCVYRGCHSNSYLDEFYCYPHLREPSPPTTTLQSPFEEPVAPPPAPSTYSMSRKEFNEHCHQLEVERISSNEKEPAPNPVSYHNAKITIRVIEGVQKGPAPSQLCAAPGCYGVPVSGISKYCAPCEFDIFGPNKRTNGKEDTTGAETGRFNYDKINDTKGPQYEKAKRYNTGKLALNLVTWEWIKWLAELLQAGANKYSPDNPTEENWKKSLNTSDHDSFVYDRRESAKRHLMMYDSGELIDPDTKSPHMVMVAWNCLVVAWYDFYKEKV